MSFLKNLFQPKHLIKLLKTEISFLNKNKTFSLLFLFFILLACDQFIKHLFFLTFGTLQTESFLGFSLESILNHHWIFGLQFARSPLISSIFFSGLLCSVLYIYILCIYYLSFTKLFNVSLTILISGIVSNLIDRIRMGYVLDFIAYKWNPYISIHFNSSDLLQTLAWLLIIYTILFYRKKIWVFKEKRETLLVMKKQQLQFIFYLTITALCIAGFFILLNYQFLNYFQTLNIKDEIPHHLMNTFFHYSLAILTVLIIPIIILAVYFSNKFYGPIYAFNKNIRELLSGKNPKKLQLRENDQLKKEFEDLASEIRNKIQKP